MEDIFSFNCNPVYSLIECFSWFLLNTIICFLIDVDGPDNVVLKPGNTALNVTEGTTVGPINCTATCYPTCLFQWKLNKTKKYEKVVSGETLVVVNITKNQAGTYRCLVFHPYNTTRLKRTDVSVNVQC